MLLNTTALPGSIVANLAPQPFALTGFNNNNPQGAAVADINGDGKPDLASTVAGVTVVINTSVPGTGVTSFGNSQSVAAGSTPEGVAFADFNADGRPDMVVVDEFDNAVSVYRNDTVPGALTPAFAARQTFAIPNGFAQPVAAADVDGDGRPDILVFNSGGLQVRLNTTSPGSATFSFGAAQTVNVGASFISMAVADFNGDGRPDVVVGNQDAGITVTFDTTLPAQRLPASAPARTSPARTRAMSRWPTSITMACRTSFR